MSTENMGESSLGKRKSMPIEVGIGGPNLDAEYEAKMNALIRQREAFEKGIAEYRGNMDKVRALRKKLKKPDLFTEKEYLEKWNMWKLNMSEYEKSLVAVEMQIQDLQAEYGRQEEHSPLQ